MKMDGLRDLTKDELLQKREEIREELFNLRLRKGIRELDNPLKLRTLRRDIARSLAGLRGAWTPHTFNEVYVGGRWRRLVRIELIGVGVG